MGNIKSMRQFLEQKNPALYEAYLRSWDLAMKGWLPSVIPNKGSYNSYPHLKNIERYLDDLLFLPENKAYHKIELTDSEVYTLLCSILFHDIGKATDEKDDHARKSKEMVLQHWAELGIVSLHFARVIAEICHAHDYKEKDRELISTLSNTSYLDEYRTIRARSIATLLFLGDHLDGAYTRTMPEILADKTGSVGAIGDFRGTTSGIRLDLANKMVTTVIDKNALVYEDIFGKTNTKSPTKPTLRFTKDSSFFKIKDISFIKKGTEQKIEKTSIREAIKKQVQVFPLTDDIEININDNEIIKKAYENAIDKAIQEDKIKIQMTLTSDEKTAKDTNGRDVESEKIVVQKHLHDRLKNDFSKNDSPVLIDFIVDKNLHDKIEYKNNEMPYECELCLDKESYKDLPSELKKHICRMDSENDKKDNEKEKTILTDIAANVCENHFELQRIRNELYELGIPLTAWYIEYEGMLYKVDVITEIKDEGGNDKHFAKRYCEHKYVKEVNTCNAIEPSLTIDYLKEILKAMYLLSGGTFGIEYHEYEDIMNYMCETPEHLEKIKCGVRRLSMLFKFPEVGCKHQVYFTIYYEDRVWGIRTNIYEKYENKSNCDKTQCCTLCNNKYLCNYKAGKNDLSYAYEGLQSYLKSILTIIPDESKKEEQK